MTANTKNIKKQRKGVNFVKKNEKYESAELELVYFDASDIVTASPVLGGDEDGGQSGPTWDTNGWT